MINGASGIAMTDLFISATAALLIVLAISRPQPPQELPIQADLLARCVMDADAPVALEITRAAMIGEDAPVDETQARVDAPGGLAAVPEELSLSPGLFYMIALVPDAAGVLRSDCFHWARDEIVRAYNDTLSDRSEEGETGALFTLSPALMEAP